MSLEDKYNSISILSACSHNDFCFFANTIFDISLFWSTFIESIRKNKTENPISLRSIWVFFGRNDAKAETPVLWLPHVKSWLIGKDSDAGRDWGQEEKGKTENEMAGWHHQLNGHEFEWTPGDGDWQGGLACSDSWGCKESDTTERLIWSDLIWWQING